jgi:hypothetical protein
MPQHYRTRNITVRSVVYHRNGIGGEGFYLVAFRADGKNLLAVVFQDEERPGDVSRTAVFDPVASVGTGDPLDTYGGPSTVERFRGADVSGDDLAAAIADATDKWQAARDARDAEEVPA